MLSIDQFTKIEMKTGTVIEAADFIDSDKLLKLKVDFGGDDQKQVLSGLKEWYKPESLIGKQFIFVTNLEPRIIIGQKSEAMILAVKTATKPIMIKPSHKVPNGQTVG